MVVVAAVAVVAVVVVPLLVSAIIDCSKMGIGGCISHSIVMILFYWGVRTMNASMLIFMIVESGKIEKKWRPLGCGKNKIVARGGKV